MLPYITIFALILFFYLKTINFVLSSEIIKVYFLAVLFNLNAALQISSSVFAQITWLSAIKHEFKAYFYLTHSVLCLIVNFESYYLLNNIGDREHTCCTPLFISTASIFSSLFV